MRGELTKVERGTKECVKGMWLVTHGGRGTNKLDKRAGNSEENDYADR